MRWLAGAVVLVGLAGGVLGQAAAPDPHVALVDHVSVIRPRITLADLLPRGASPGLIYRASGIDLGRAPQAGSIRILEREWLRERLRETEFTGAVIPERIVVERAPPAKRERVVEGVKTAILEYLRQRGAGDAALSAELAWSPNLPEVPPGVPFRVLGAQWEARPGLLQFRMACAGPRTCMPFFVGVYFPDSGNRDLVRERLAQRPPLPSAPASETAMAENPAGARPRKKSRAPILAHPGTLASMSVEVNGIRIFTQVVCLEHGVEGQVIKVRNPESKRILRAQVVGPGRVRGPV